MTLYEQCIQNGCSPKMAEMLSAQTPPGLKVANVALMHARLNNQDLDRMPKNQAQFLVENAKRRGISVSGKVYVSGLADRPGDPNAWVSDDSEMLAKCKSKGLSCEGAVTYTAPEKPPKKICKLNPKIVNERVRKEIAKDPSKAKNIPELREAIIEKHGSPYGITEL